MNHLSDDEFGKYFEIGMKARAEGRAVSSNKYRHEQRSMAFKDGWEAAEAAINNHSLPDTADSILNKLSI